MVQLLSLLLQLLLAQVVRKDALPPSPSAQSAVIVKCIIMLQPRRCTHGCISCLLVDASGRLVPPTLLSLRPCPALRLLLAALAVAQAVS
jgi:hypothetical protein